MLLLVFNTWSGSNLVTAYQHVGNIATNMSNQERERESVVFRAEQLEQHQQVIDFEQRLAHLRRMGSDMFLPDRNQLLRLDDVLSSPEISQLKRTRNIKLKSSKLVQWIAQTLNYFPWTYEYAVRLEAGDSTKDVENPLKTILITSWLCHAVAQGKLAYNGKPIRLKMNDYLVHHIWDFSLPTEYYSMCVESLYLFYQDANGFETEFLSLDQLRVYPALRSDKPKLKGKQRCYLKVKNQICQIVEQAFLQHHLYLPTPPKVYNPLSKVDVSEWFSSILVANSINPIQVSNEILDHVSQVQAVCQKYAKRRNTEKNVQSVWVSF